MSNLIKLAAIRSASLFALLALFPVAGLRAADVYLKADTTTKIMPDGTTVTFWGYVRTNAAFTPLPGEVVKVPGPRLTLSPADTSLTIHLFNALPQPTSLVISGFPLAPVPTWTDGTSGPRGASIAKRVRSFTSETAPGTSSIYSFTGLKPGTYLYESGTHPSVQVQMGLYGCLTRDSAAGEAYPGVLYDNDAVMLFSEVDPALHAAVVGGTYGTPAYPSTIDYTPKYYLINGESFPASQPLWGHPPVATERVLLRYLSASLETHVPVVQDLYMSVVAEDGNPLPYAREQYSVTLLAGKTTDALIDRPPDGNHPIYDRRFRFSVGAAARAQGLPNLAGMITSLKISPSNEKSPNGLEIPPAQQLTEK